MTMLDTTPNVFDWIVSQASACEALPSRTPAGKPPVSISDLLTALAERPEGRTARDLSSALGLSMWQTYRSIRIAVQLGCVEAIQSPSMGKIGRPRAVVRLSRP